MQMIKYGNLWRPFSFTSFLSGLPNRKDNIKSLADKDNGRFLAYNHNFSFFVGVVVDGAKVIRRPEALLLYATLCYSSSNIRPRNFDDMGDVQPLGLPLPVVVSGGTFPNLVGGRKCCREKPFVFPWGGFFREAVSPTDATDATDVFRTLYTREKTGFP